MTKREWLGKAIFTIQPLNHGSYTTEMKDNFKAEYKLKSENTNMESGGAM